MKGKKKYIFGLTKAFLVKMFSFMFGGQKLRKNAYFWGHFSQKMKVKIKFFKISKKKLCSVNRYYFYQL